MLHGVRAYAHEPVTTSTAKRRTESSAAHVPQPADESSATPSVVLAKAAPKNASQKALALLMARPKGPLPNIQPKTTDRPMHITTQGADDLVIVQNGSHGGLRVTVNGHAFNVAPENAQDLTISTGTGRDRIIVADDVSFRLRLHGGDGDDIIHGGAGHDRVYGGDGDDTIHTGAGDDYVEGQAGNDVIAGGPGRDVLYGLDGTDVLDGGRDADYLDGGRGADTLLGRDGPDALLGGRGQDILLGGAGDDALAGGRDTDTLKGGAGADKLYVQADDEARIGDGDQIAVVDTSKPVGTSFRRRSPPEEAAMGMAGKHRTFELPRRVNPDFAARFESDLEALRSIPSGRRLLQELDHSGGTLTVRETTDDQQGSAIGALGSGRKNNGIDYHRSQINPVDGKEAELRSHGVDPSVVRARPSMHAPPAVSLGHELVHARHQFEGDRSKGQIMGPGSAANEELRTTGLQYDHDNDPETPPQADTQGVTEADLRDDLNLPVRDRYYTTDVKGDGLLP